MGYIRLEKYKSRLNFDGYTLFPVFEKLMKEKDRKTFNYIKDTYGDALNEYVKSISKGGSSIEESKPPIVIGPREKINQVLAIFLLMLEDLQGKQFSLEDLNLVKNEQNEDSEDVEVFRKYNQIAIVDIHNSMIKSDKMKNWRMECLRESIVTRQRARKPLIVVSEVVLPNDIRNSELFTVITLFSAKEMNEINIQEAKEKAEAGETVRLSSEEINSATLF